MTVVFFPKKIASGLVSVCQPFYLLSNEIFFVILSIQVTCDERYSDLEKSMYLPSPNNGGFSQETEKYEGVYDVKNIEEFVRLHPCAQLGPKQVRNHIQPQHNSSSFSFTITYKSNRHSRKLFEGKLLIKGFVNPK